MGNAASSRTASQPTVTRRKKFSLRPRIRRTTVASGSATTQTSIQVRPARSSLLASSAVEENLPNAEFLFEIDSLDLKKFRHLSDGVEREIHTDAVWATIPHALNGRASKVLLVDRHQRILTKREYSKVFQELKHHVHLSTAFCENAQGDPTFGSQQHHVPKLQELQHPHILRLYGHFMQNRMLHVLTEFCQHGNLGTVLDFDERYHQKRGHRLPIFNGNKALEESARQLVQGVRFMHESQLAHTNLTPENVFVNDNGRILVGDFKDAIFVGAVNKQHSLASPTRHGFAAPERYVTEDDESVSSKIDLLRADAWSVGVLIFLMATRVQLFHGASLVDPDFEQFTRMGFLAYYEMWESLHGNQLDPSMLLSENIKLLLTDLLHVDPEKRCTVVDAARQFEWLHANGVVTELNPSEWKLTI